VLPESSSYHVGLLPQSRLQLGYHYHHSKDSASYQTCHGQSD
jgi:hypothetical protein